MVYQNSKPFIIHKSCTIKYIVAKYYLNKDLHTRGAKADKTFSNSSGHDSLHTGSVCIFPVDYPSSKGRWRDVVFR